MSDLVTHILIGSPGSYVQGHIRKVTTSIDLYVGGGGAWILQRPQHGDRPVVVCTAPNDSLAMPILMVALYELNCKLFNQRADEILPRWRPETGAEQIRLDVSDKMLGMLSVELINHAKELGAVALVVMEWHDRPATDLGFVLADKLGWSIEVCKPVPLARPSKA
jgi:hypothetical protein